MFQALKKLVASCDKVVLTLKMEGGQMTVVVTPVVDKATDAALKHPLGLTASPAELDEQFADLLLGYTDSRRSLADQAAATESILAAAKQTQVKKATSAIAKGGKSSASNAQASDDEHEDDELPGGSAAAPAEVQTPVAPQGTNMADLLG